MTMLLLEEFVVLLMVQGINAQFMEQPAAGTRIVSFTNRVTFSCSVEAQYLIDWEVAFDNGPPILAGRIINDATFAQRNFTIIGVATRTSTLSFGILDSVGSETNNGTTVVCIAQQGTTPTRGNQVLVIFTAPSTESESPTTATTQATSPETIISMATSATMATSTTSGDIDAIVIGIISAIFFVIIVLVVGVFAGLVAIVYFVRKKVPEVVEVQLYGMHARYEGIEGIRYQGAPYNGHEASEVAQYEEVAPYRNHNGHTGSEAAQYEEVTSFENRNGQEGTDAEEGTQAVDVKEVKLRKKPNGHVPQMVNYSSGKMPPGQTTRHSDVPLGYNFYEHAHAGGTPVKSRGRHSDGFYTPGQVGTPSAMISRQKDRLSSGYSTPRQVGTPDGGTPTVIYRKKTHHNREANSTPQRVSTPTGGMFSGRKSRNSDVVPVYYFIPGQPAGETPVMFYAQRTRHYSDVMRPGQVGTPIEMRSSKEHPVLSHAYSATSPLFGSSDPQTASTTKCHPSSDASQPPKPRASSDAPMEAAGEHRPLYSCDQRTLRHNTSIAPPPPFPNHVCNLEDPPPDLDLYTVNQDYSSDQPEHLSVSEGEKVLILWKTDTGDWFRAVNIEEEVGWVPGLILSKDHSLENYSWFHDIATEDAYKILCKSTCHWSFLVKNSESRPDEYTIGMYCANEITYYHIFFKNDQFYVTSAMSFESISQLLHFYSKDHPHFYRRVLFLHPISNKWKRLQEKFFEEPTPLPPNILPLEWSTIEADSEPDTIISAQ